MLKCSICEKFVDKQTYKVKLEHNREYENTKNHVEFLLFCAQCAKDLKNTLSKIENKLKSSIGPNCWTDEPLEEGPHFVWDGTTMKIVEVVPMDKGNDRITPTNAYKARLWSGPIKPPLLPYSESALVQKLKIRKGNF